jgi:single-stranded DNA-binding protein
MIDGLVSGRLFGKAAERSGASGKVFVAAKLRVADGDGEGLFISVVAFSDSAKAGLLALDDGDSCALAGPLKIGTFEARDGSVKPSVSLVAHAVLSQYHVQRKRRAVAEASEPKPGQPSHNTIAGKHRGLKDLAMLYGEGAGEIGDIDDDLADLRP